jgi:hypothetical protein
MQIPTVHSNGSGEKNLTKQIKDVYVALHDVIDVMRQASPHGRDYYTQEDGAFEKARDEHEARIAKVKSVMDDMLKLNDGIMEQCRK